MRHLLVPTILLSSILVSLIFSPTAFGADAGMEALKRLPIQDAGRIKPFDTFARETLTLVYGRSSYKPPEPKEGSADAKTADRRSRRAMEIVMTWFLAPGFWDNQEVVEVRFAGLKEALKLDVNRERFSPSELFANDRLGLVFQDLGSFRETKQKLNPYYQEVQRLENQLGIYQQVKEGKILRFVPPKPTTEASAADAMMKEPDRWQAIAEVDGALRESFATVAKSFIRSLPGVGETPVDSVPTLEKAVADFQVLAREVNPTLYPDGKAIDVEVHYEALHPFRIAWALYLIAAIAMGFAWGSATGSPRAKSFAKAGWTFAILAFLMQTYGFCLRVYLTGRPPVSNMYETVIWVSWGAMLFSFIFEARQKALFVLLSGSVVAALCNIVADFAPNVLDSSLQPLEPVLRSNLWLMVHVLVIVISYSAFFLAWALGNIGLGFVVRGATETHPMVDALVIAIYRCMQVGVVLLAAGTILGGVWADYSWGRFWGWDPKETWAFIALMGYIAILHARLTGWLKKIGTMVGAVIAFNLVMMSWYGVNFVLGAGLHSYGFGAGGVEYVSAFVLLNLAFVGYAVATLRGRRAA